MMDDSDTPIHSSKDIFLSPDERYQVWTVKRAERPELLERNQSALTVTTEPSPCGDEIDQTEPTTASFQEETAEIANENDSHDQDDELPLTDGCDLIHWRRQRFAELSRHGELQALLNVGYGCSLLRRERQLPIPSSNAFSRWNKLCQRLLEPPQSTAPVIHVSDDDETIDPWFERDNAPVIILGCTQHWKAMKSCQLHRLVESFGDWEWRFSDTHGETMTLNTYAKYIHWEGQLDDAPLAIYDSQFDQDERACLLQDYQVPRCFSADLFDLLPDDQRPPYRWILIGPARSGTGLHIDPVGTHAWVTLVQGCKRWVLFPYGTDPASIHLQEPAIPSAIWFRDYYHKVMPHHAGAVEVLQRPGETVYVPAGWPHLVLNLETSVAITQNYAAAEPSMSRLWQALSEAEPEMAQLFYKRLEEHRPDLAEAINS